jgi:hypothetical protein
MNTTGIEIIRNIDIVLFLSSKFFSMITKFLRYDNGIIAFCEW